MATHREIEGKVRWEPGEPLPPIDVGPAAVRSEAGEPVDLQAHYYDTADLRLLRWGVTLRRRTGGDDEGWHLKLPQSADGILTRDEVRLRMSSSDSGDGAAQVPAELAQIVRSLIREAALEHVATVFTHRTPYALKDLTGTSLAELSDDLVTTEVAGVEGPSFREIEVEAAEGQDDRSAREVVGQVIASLVDSGAEPVERSKLAEALGPRADAPPDVLVPAVPTPKDPVGDVVRWVLAGYARKLLLQEVRLQRHQPDAVHQARVAKRKLRSALRTFRPVLDRQWADTLDDQLKAAAEVWRVARDTEVHFAGLSRAAAALEAEDRDHVMPVIERALKERLAESSATGEQHLADAQHIAVLVDVVQAARAPRLKKKKARRPAGKELPKLVHGTTRRLKCSIRDLTLDSSREDWHHARIKAKRARYMADAAAHVLGGKVEDLADSLEDVTDLLGHHQDRQVAREILRSIAGQDDVTPSAAYALGLLEAGEMARAKEDRARFLRHRKKLKRQLR